MIQLEMAYKLPIATFMYLSSTTDWILKLVHQRQPNKNLHSIIKEARKCDSDLDLNLENFHILTYQLQNKPSMSWELQKPVN